MQPSQAPAAHAQRGSIASTTTMSSVDEKEWIKDSYTIDMPTDASDLDDKSNANIITTKSLPRLFNFAKKAERLPISNNGSRAPDRPSSRWKKRVPGKRTVLLSLPVVILTLFGIIHLVLVISGGARFYWTVDHDYLLPGMTNPYKEGFDLTNITRNVMPVPVHSHNDYWRHTPLFEALSWGCTSVEADVWHFDGDDELYVGHHTGALSKDRTFRGMYVDPLVKLLDEMSKSNGPFDDEDWQGVFSRISNQTLVLLVDLKTAGKETLTSVSSQLEPLRSRDYLSYWNGSTLHTRAVTVVSSGNTPFDDIITASGYRDIFNDAPLDDLFSKDFNSNNSYYASVSFAKTIGHVWNGYLSSQQTNTIREQVAAAHERGLKVRYWDTPGWPVNLRNYVWDALVSEGADVLNADDLKAAVASDWKKRVHGLWY